MLAQRQDDSADIGPTMGQPTLLSRLHYFTAHDLDLPSRRLKVTVRHGNMWIIFTYFRSS